MYILFPPFWSNMSGQVLRKLHAGGADIHSRTIIISSGRAAASSGLLLFLSLSYGAACAALICALSKSCPVYHSPLFPGPTYYPVQSKTRNIRELKATSSDCPKQVPKWQRFSAGAGVSGSDFLSPDSLGGCEVAVVRHQRALSERRTCVTAHREVRLEIG